MTHSPLAVFSSLKSTSLLANASSSGLFLAIGIFILLFLLFVLVVLVIYVVSMWRVYEKAGMPGWSVLIPLYNNVKFLQINGQPLWWVLLLFVPFVNIVILIFMTRRLAAVFGKGLGFTYGLIFLPFIFYPILAFGKSVYVNTFPPAAPMSEAVKWTLVAGVVFLLVEIYASSFTTRLLELGNTHSSMLVPISIPLGYAADDTYVYYLDRPIYNADPSSFKVDGDYGMDSKSVYYGSQIIPNANPTTFTVLNDGAYATSEDAVYYDGSLIDGADTVSFTDAIDPSGNHNYDAKDSKNYYFEGVAIALPSNLKVTK
jgi:hypothetical protein